MYNDPGQKSMLSFWRMAVVSLAVVRAATFVLPAGPANSYQDVGWAGGGPSSVAFPSALPPAALLDLGESELRTRIESDPASLGSLSIGSPSGGILLNGTAVPTDPGWEIVNVLESLGTAETVSFIRTAVGKVREIYPDSPAIYIGDISDAQGGRLNRHISHQAGRDVDLGFYYKSGRGWWHAPGTSANLDLPRNWAFVRALLHATDVEAILLDNRIQRLLYKHALSIGEDKAWLDRVFRFVKGARDAKICHVSGHRTHYHVRFFNPVAQELGRRAYPILVSLKKINPPVLSVRHVVRQGETLGQIARRYGVSVRAIQSYNGLSSSLIRAGRSYRIPVKGVAAPKTGPLIVPARMLAPRTPAALAAYDWPTPIGMYGEMLVNLARHPLPLRGHPL